VDLAVGPDLRSIAFRFDDNTVVDPAGTVRRAESQGRFQIGAVVVALRGAGWA